MSIQKMIPSITPGKIFMLHCAPHLESFINKVYKINA